MITIETVFNASYDHRESDPDDGSNRGAHGVEMTLIYRGTNGIITTRVSTGWMSNTLEFPYSRVQKAPRKRTGRPGMDPGLPGVYPVLGPAAYHSIKQIQKSDSFHERCELLNGPCWGDVSYMAAETVFTALTSKGGEGALLAMEELHDTWLLGVDE